MTRVPSARERRAAELAARGRRAQGAAAGMPQRWLDLSLHTVRALQHQAEAAIGLCRELTDSQHYPASRLLPDMLNFWQGWTATGRELCDQLHGLPELCTNERSEATGPIHVACAEPIAELECSDLCGSGDVLPATHVKLRQRGATQLMVSLTDLKAITPELREGLYYGTVSRKTDGHVIAKLVLRHRRLGRGRTIALRF